MLRGWMGLWGFRYKMRVGRHGGGEICDESNMCAVGLGMFGGNWVFGAYGGGWKVWRDPGVCDGSLKMSWG